MKSMSGNEALSGLAAVAIVFESAGEDSNLSRQLSGWACELLAIMPAASAIGGTEP